MGLESLFSGNALQAVDGEGAMLLPAFVLRALSRRSESRRVMFSPHELDPCINGYDEGHADWLFVETERRRLRDESLGLAADEHHRRARRAFGAAESAPFDARGRIVLPPAVRRRARLDGAALIVGTGGSFEIWNPDIARTSGDDELSRLAADALAAGADSLTDEVEA
jgi:MraZ protein